MAYNDLKMLTTQTYLVPSTEGTAYTTPSGKTVEISSIWFHNCHTAAVSCYIYLPVTAGNSGANGNLRDYFTLAANETYEMSPKTPFVLTADSIVRCSASVDAKISMMITGREQQ